MLDLCCLCVAGSLDVGFGVVCMLGLWGFLVFGVSGILVVSYLDSWYRNFEFGICFNSHVWIF